jgi:4-amino-4-deoxy-L-arabinose transferase-like glycosyltransferase
MLKGLKKKVKHFFQKKRGIYAVLVLILLLGAFLRMYHLSDWLHFELDQARDAKVIVAAIDNGIGNLPLLGPRAGGTFLRLGPGFYYMEYLGALVFGSTPGGLAVPIALFSIASIAVFFFLMRRYFKTTLTLGLTMLFSVSAFMVLYGRFAWNPNPLPFFLMLGMYALLRSVDHEEVYKERWFIISAFLLTLATHLHFLAFVVLPVIVGAFLLIKRARFSWKTWLAVGAVVAMLYMPMVFNEIITGGANSQEFIQAVQGKSNKSKHTLAEQLVRDTTNHALGYWVVLTGYEESSMGQFISRGTVDFELLCDDDCHAHLVSALLALGIFVGGGLLLIVGVWRETDARKKDFLLLSLLWFGACFALFLPLSYDFAPRFFLLVAPFPFLFLGLIFVFCQRFFRRYASIVIVLMWLALVSLIVSNLFFTTHRLSELKRASFENFDTLPDRILKEKTRVTLKQQGLVLDYMQRFQVKNGYPIYMFSEPEHRRALKYLMGRRGMSNDVLGYSSDIYAQGNYFLIVRTESNHENRLQKYMLSYDVAGEETIGTLTVFRLQPKHDAITADVQVFDMTPKSAVSDPRVPERYTWSEWWNHQSGSADDEVIDENGG